MAKKRTPDDPLPTLLETASKAQLVDLVVRVAASHPAVRSKCLDYLNRHTALSHCQKKQSEGEKLLALWSELRPDLDELDEYSGGDYGADFHVSSLLQKISQALSRKKIEATYRQQLLDNVLPYIESGNAGLDDELYEVAYAACYNDDDWRSLAEAFARLRHQSQTGQHQAPGVSRRVQQSRAWLAGIAITQRRVFSEIG